MKTQTQLIEMYENLLTKKDTISYGIMKEEWEAKLQAIKDGKYKTITFEPSLKLMRDDAYKNNSIYKLFLEPLGKMIRDQQRAWDEEFFGLKRGVIK